MYKLNRPFDDFKYINSHPTPTLTPTPTSGPTLTENVWFNSCLHIPAGETTTEIPRGGDFCVLYNFTGEILVGGRVCDITTPINKLTIPLLQMSGNSVQLRTNLEEHIHLEMRTYMITDKEERVKLATSTVTLCDDHVWFPSTPVVMDLERILKDTNVYLNLKYGRTI
jgi:hypothetical protein